MKQDLQNINHKDTPKLARIIKCGPNSVSANEFLDLPSNTSLIIDQNQIRNLKKGKSWTYSTIEAIKQKNILFDLESRNDSILMDKECLP